MLRSGVLIIELSSLTSKQLFAPELVQTDLGFTWNTLSSLSFLTCVQPRMIWHWCWKKYIDLSVLYNCLGRLLKRWFRSWYCWCNSESFWFLWKAISSPTECSNSRGWKMIMTCLALNEAFQFRQHRTNCLSCPFFGCLLCWR